MPLTKALLAGVSTRDLTQFAQPNREQDPITVDGGDLAYEPQPFSEDEADWLIMDWQRLEVGFTAATDRVITLMI